MSELDRTVVPLQDDDIDVARAALLPPREDAEGKPICRKPGCPKRIHSRGLCQSHYRTAVRLTRNGGRKVPGPAPEPTATRSRHNLENPDRLRDQDGYRRANLKRYGLTPESYELMLELQGGKCAVCRTDFSKQVRRPHVDHDHVTGRVRGILCNGCNVALGHTYDNPAILRALADYLEEFSETPAP